MSGIKRFINKTAIVIAAFVAVGAFITLSMLRPARDEAGSLYALLFVAALLLFYIAKAVWVKIRPSEIRREKLAVFGNIMLIVISAIFLWEFFTAKFDIVDSFLWPSPGVIIHLFFTDMPLLLQGLRSSVIILFGGYLLAVAVAVPLGLFIGSRRRLHLTAKPLAKVLGPIPPTVYIPYAIVLLPTFRMGSIFIIFIGAFWPIFVNTLNGVLSIDKRTIDSARVIHMKQFDMLTKVILPGSIPFIMTGAIIGLSASFILLTSAEMIGATSGMGWYVRFFSDFAQYDRVIVGIIFIGVVVSVIRFFFDLLERYLLRWRK